MRIITGKIFNRIGKQRIKKYVLYIIFGSLTTMINFGIFYLLSICIFYIFANIIALVFSRTFAYITNKLFVFRSKCNTKFELLKEYFLFNVSRGISSVIDIFGLMLMVSVFNFDQNISKLFLIIFIFIINYFLSSKIVFKKEEREL